jgi:hypothetical protein
LLACLGRKKRFWSKLFVNEGSWLKKGCQMVYFLTKNPDLGKLSRGLQWMRLVYFIAIWSIIRTFGIIYGHLFIFFGELVHFPVLVSINKWNLAALFFELDVSWRLTGRAEERVQTRSDAFHTWCSASSIRQTEHVEDVSRDCQIFSTKTGRNVPKSHNICELAIKYTKLLYKMQNIYTINQICIQYTNLL